MVLSGVDAAEVAWGEASLASTVEEMRPLLHPEFVAVHGPMGQFQGAEEFIADAAARPRPLEVTVLSSAIREINDTATVSCIQEMRIPFAPDVPPFVIQATVTRVWVSDEGHRPLARLQMARRMPPA